MRELTSFILGAGFVYFGLWATTIMAYPEPDDPDWRSKAFTSFLCLALGIVVMIWPR